MTTTEITYHKTTTGAGRTFYASPDGDEVGLDFQPTGKYRVVRGRIQNGIQWADGRRGWLVPNYITGSSEPDALIAETEG